MRSDSKCNCMHVGRKPRIKTCKKLYSERNCLTEKSFSSIPDIEYHNEGGQFEQRRMEKLAATGKRTLVDRVRSGKTLISSFPGSYVPHILKSRSIRDLPDHVDCMGA